MISCNITVERYGFVSRPNTSFGIIPTVMLRSMIVKSRSGAAIIDFIFIIYDRA